MRVQSLGSESGSRDLASCRQISSAPGDAPISFPSRASNRIMSPPGSSDWLIAYGGSRKITSNCESSRSGNRTYSAGAW